ncbi:MAG: hypothetical protein O7D86_06845 [Proteobacteria bacterium]|nr:hypothetical protein [Pseudomonadota bacterium]
MAFLDNVARIFIWQSNRELMWSTKTVQVIKGNHFKIMNVDVSIAKR